MDTHSQLPVESGSLLRLSSEEGKCKITVQRTLPFWDSCEEFDLAYELGM